MTTHPSIQTTPPPLPVPGSTGGVEHVPSVDRASDEQSVKGQDDSTCSATIGGPVRTYLVFMVFFVALWAATGAGHFWPIWPMLGWGLGLFTSGAVTLGGHRRRR